MRHLILFASLTILLFASSCKTDPCKGEPGEIAFDEIIELRLLTENDQNVFDGLYSIDSLSIMENGEKINYDYIFRGQLRILTFNSNMFSFDSIASHYNTEMETEIILQFNSQEEDTMHIQAKPRRYSDDCFMHSEYEFFNIKYNITTVRQETNTTCFTCGNRVLTIKVSGD